MTDTTTESEVVEEKKPVKEVPIVKDQGYFRHDTGDTYDGFFEAKKKDRNVKMNGTILLEQQGYYLGPGVYTTADGEVYTGMWEADKLGCNEEVIISYPDGSKYEGTFKDWSYAGHAKYSYPDSSQLECDFIENCPVGNLTLTDPNGQVWLGRAEQGYGWLEPVNHFYTILEKTRESNKFRKRHRSIVVRNSTV